MAEAALPTEALRERVARCSFTPRIRTPRYIRFDVRAAANRRAHERKDLYDSGVVWPERGSGEPKGEGPGRVPSLGTTFRAHDGLRSGHLESESTPARAVGR